jgi:uncharacterized delta-60 repeat protein
MRGNKKGQRAVIEALEDRRLLTAAIDIKLPSGYPTDTAAAGNVVSFAVDSTALTQDISGTSTPRDPLTSHWIWSAGDTSGQYNSLEGFNFSHIYDTPGSYTATLTVIDPKPDHTGTISTTYSYGPITIESSTTGSLARRQYFVASTTAIPAGNDSSNSGLDAAHPFATPAHALEIANDTPSQNVNGSSGSTYEILLHQGDTFELSLSSNLDGITGTNVVIGDYHEPGGSTAKPIIDQASSVGGFTALGTPGFSATTHGAVTIQNIEFASQRTPDYNNADDGANLMKVIDPSGTDIAVSNCIFQRVYSVFTANQTTIGAYLVDNSDEISGEMAHNGLLGYFCFGTGLSDVTIVGNVIGGFNKDSTNDPDHLDQHVVRAEGTDGAGVTYLLAADNNFSNSFQSTFDLHDGSKWYITGNTLTGGPNGISGGAGVGPLFGADGVVATETSRASTAVFEGNRLNNTSFQVTEGASGVMFRNNIIKQTVSAGHAFNIESRDFFRQDVDGVDDDGLDREPDNDNETGTNDPDNDGDAGTDSDGDADTDATDVDNPWYIYPSRYVENVTIINNTYINEDPVPSDGGVFLRLDDPIYYFAGTGSTLGTVATYHTTGGNGFAQPPAGGQITFDNNLMIAPFERSGNQDSGLLYFAPNAGNPDLNLQTQSLFFAGFKEIHDNIIPLLDNHRTDTNGNSYGFGTDRGTAPFFAGETANLENEYMSYAQFAAQSSVVSGTNYENEPLFQGPDGNFVVPSPFSFAATTAASATATTDAARTAGVVTDFFGTPRISGPVTVGAVQVAMTPPQNMSKAATTITSTSSTATTFEVGKDGSSTSTATLTFAIATLPTTGTIDLQLHGHVIGGLTTSGVAAMIDVYVSGTSLTMSLTTPADQPMAQPVTSNAIFSTGASSEPYNDYEWDVTKAIRAAQSASSSSIAFIVEGSTDNLTMTEFTTALADLTFGGSYTFVQIGSSSDSNLIISGTDGNDSFAVAPSGTGVALTMNGNTATVNDPSGRTVTAITINASGGNDSLTVNSGSFTFDPSSVVAGVYSINFSNTGSAQSLTVGAATLTVPTDVSASTLHLSITENSASSSITFTGTQHVSSLTATTNSAVVLDGSSGTFTFNGSISGSAVITKTGASTWVLVSSNTYTGTTTVNSGLLQLGDGVHTGSISSTSVVLNNTDGQGLLFELPGSATISYAISGTGAVGVNSIGIITFTSTSNSYGGPTTIFGGTLAAGANNALSSMSTVTLAGGTLDIGAYNETAAGIVLSNGTITSSSGTLTAGSYTMVSGTAAAILAGAANLTKTGAGTVIITATNLYSGSTTVAGGILELGDGTSVGSVGTDVTVLSGANLEFDVPASNNQTFGHIISGAGRLEKDGAGNLILSQTNTYGAGTRIFSGTLSTSSDSNLGASGTTVLIGGGTLNITSSVSSSARIFDGEGGTISLGAGINFSTTGSAWGTALTLSGSGTFTVNNFNIFGLTISGGTLRLSAGGSKAAQVSSLSIASGAALDLNDNALVMGYSGTSPISTIRGYLATGYNGGAWNGSGIASTAASNDPHHVHALGYAEASDLDVTTFDGISVSNAVLVKYTYYGDNNLDGVVDIGNDFNLFEAGDLSGGSSWVYGDYNYSGSVDDNDFGKFIDGYAASNPGQGLDTAFGTNGAVTTDIEGGRDILSATAVTPDGHLLAAGYSEGQYGSHPFHFAVVEYNADGSLNTSFGTGGKVVLSGFTSTSSDNAEAIVVQSDGKFILVGFTTDSSYAKVALARFNSDGSLDTTYGTSGRVVSDTLDGNGPPYLDIHYMAAALDSNGKLLVTASKDGDFELSRYTTAGALDTTFGSSGTVVTDVGGTDTANSIAIQSDGKIVVAGNSGNSLGVVRYTSSGAPDTTFATGGIFTGLYQAWRVAFCDGIAIQPSDGKILIGGESQTGSTSYGPAILRLTTSGAIDTTFASSGSVVVASLDGWTGFSFIRQTDGSLVLVGGAPTGGSCTVRFTSSGSLDTSFAGTGIAIMDMGFQDVGLSVTDFGGNIIVGGTINKLDGNGEDFAVVEYLA